MVTSTMHYTLFVILTCLACSCSSINSNFNTLLKKLEETYGEINDYCAENPESKTCSALGPMALVLSQGLRSVEVFIVDKHAPTDRGLEKYHKKLEKLFKRLGNLSEKGFEDANGLKKFMSKVIIALRKWGNSFKTDVEGLGGYLGELNSWLDKVQMNYFNKMALLAN